MYQEYRRLCQQGRLQIGQLHVYRAPDKIIVNFPTKQHWRQPSRLQTYGIATVAFPQLGCGFGGLTWETQVKPVMEHYLIGLSVPVYIHLYTPKS
jgi:hypothetical protein